MLKFTRRVLSIIGVVVGWALLLGIHLSSDHNAFVSFVAVPTLMLVMAFTAAIQDT